MTSFQNSAGAGKAAKFVNANPLGPMADPFAGLDDDQKEYQKVVAENVNKRMDKAMGDLKKKYANGGGGQNGEGSVDQPSGDAYKDHQNAMRRKNEQGKAASEAQRLDDVATLKTERDNLRHNGRLNGEPTGDEEDEYDELLTELDHDPDMEAIRNCRMQEMRATQSERAENLAKGHGQYRHIGQDEFLPEVTSSKYVAVHFFHKNFERCKIMDHHLDLIAPFHIECKFLKIDAEKAPFFVQKLQVQTLPTLVVMKDGVVIDRLTGFGDLAIDLAEPDKWHTSKLQAWIAGTGAIKFVMPSEEIRKELKKLGIPQRGTIWSENRAHDSESEED